MVWIVQMVPDEDDRRVFEGWGVRGGEVAIRGEIERGERRTITPSRRIVPRRFRLLRRPR